MSSSGGVGEAERRKKRAWRQPRHEPGAPPPPATAVSDTNTPPTVVPASLETEGEERKESSTVIPDPLATPGGSKTTESVIEIDGSTMEGVGIAT